MMPNLDRSTIILSIVALAVAVFPAPAEATATVTVPYVHHPPVLDDFVRLQETVEGHAAGMVLVEGLVQRTPVDGAPVSERTRVYLGYDDDNIYAAFICFDADPSAIRGQLVGRERLPDDDDNVALQLDTFGDRKHAYTFQVNAAGVQRDGIWTESVSSWDFSFDAIWQSDSARTPYGYVVLITVPLSSVRFLALAEQTWGVFVMREIPRKGEVAFWPAYSSRITGRLSQSGTLAGLRHVTSSHSLQLTPYASAQALENGTSASGFDRPQAGLDAKWVIRNSYVLDATLNPDFSQVESDEPQVVVNERFETVFPEKRFFFLENAAYFQTPIPLLFTRRIADPQVGMRITGKQGPYGIAALVADDDAPRSMAGGGRAVTAVARGTRNVGRDGSLGMFVSTRERGEHSNRLFAVDGRFAWGTNWTGTWQAVSSTVSDGGLSAAGPAYTARITRSGRSLTYAATWHDRSAGFRADAGFVPRTDFRSIDQVLTYRFRPAGRRLVAWGPDVSVAQVWDRSGMRLDAAVTPRLTFEWIGPATLALFHSSAVERLRPAEVDAVTRTLDTDADRSGVEVVFNRIQHFVWSASLSRGDSINLRPLAGSEPQPGDAVEGSATASARLARGVTVDATFLSRRLGDHASGASILSNRIWRMKTTFQLTRGFGARLIVQRDSLTTDAAMTPLRSRTLLTGDLLVTYLVAPGRALFVGLSRHEHQHAVDPTYRGWQLFMKLSYTIPM